MINEMNTHNSGYTAMMEQPIIREGPDISKMIKVQVTSRTAFFVPKGTDIIAVTAKWEKAHSNSAY